MIRDRRVQASRRVMRDWLEHSSMSGGGQSYEQTVDNVVAISDRCWTLPGLHSNLLTILNGARPLADFNISFDVGINLTQYEHHDQSTAPSTFPRRQPRHQQRTIDVTQDDET